VNGALLAVAELARAGGGQNFGGGGGLGGGGGGLGGGGGSFGGGGGGFFFLPFFLGGGGLVGLILIVLLVMFLSGALGSAGRRGGSDPPPAPPPPLPPPPARTSAGVASLPYDDTHAVGVPERFRGETLPGSDAAAPAGSVPDGLAAIRAHDADFDEAAFLGRVERVFVVVQEAWSELKPDMSRQVMADALWQQHKMQIEQYQSQGRRNVLDNLSVGRADIVAAHSDDSYDTITVRILAACADYDIDTASGKVVRGDRRVSEFMEDWIFQRSSKATTKADGGTLAKRCPNCGAPLDVDLAGVCSYCKAPVMSGAYDWVLTRIDQVGAY